jgi:hypothetical protein
VRICSNFAYQSVGIAAKWGQTSCNANFLSPALELLTHSLTECLRVILQLQLIYIVILLVKFMGTDNVFSMLFDALGKHKNLCVCRVVEHRVDIIALIL